MPLENAWHVAPDMVPRLLAKPPGGWERNKLRRGVFPLSLVASVTDTASVRFCRTLRLSRQAQALLQLAEYAGRARGSTVA